MNKGKFIVFEGPDGSGKTTVALKICELLKEKGFDIVHTREPGGIDIAEQIRNVILDPKNTAMDARTEALLYAASRRQHLVQKVLPAIEDGKLVICERFLFSSLAYQGKARGIGYNGILDINNFAIEDHMPDLTIYLDIDEKLGQERINQRASKDRLDSESINFHHLVNEGYKEILDKFKDTRIVDASNDLDRVVSDCLSIIMDLIDD